VAVVWEFANNSQNQGDSGGFTVTAFGAFTGSVAGDILEVTISYAGTTAFTPPAGWSTGFVENVGNTATDSTAIRSLAMFYIVRGGSLPSLVFTRTGGSGFRAQHRRWRPNTAGTVTVAGATTNPLAVASTAWTTGTITTPADALVLAFSASGTSASSTSACTATNPSTNGGDLTTSPANITPDIWNRKASTDGGTVVSWLGTFAAVKSTSGATGTINITGSASRRATVGAIAFYVNTGGGTTDSVGSASGSGAASGAAAGIASAVGAATGSGTAAGTGRATTASVGSAAGTGAASGRRSAARRERRRRAVSSHIRRRQWERLPASVRLPARAVRSRAARGRPLGQGRPARRRAVSPGPRAPRSAPARPAGPPRPLLLASVRRRVRRRLRRCPMPARWWMRWGRLRARLGAREPVRPSWPPSARPRVRERRQASVWAFGAPRGRLSGPLRRKPRPRASRRLSGPHRAPAPPKARETHSRRRRDRRLAFRQPAARPPRPQRPAARRWAYLWSRAAPARCRTPRGGLPGPVRQPASGLALFPPAPRRTGLLQPLAPPGFPRRAAVVGSAMRRGLAASRPDRNRHADQVSRRGPELFNRLVW
jgi:hypothetical protein